MDYNFFLNYIYIYIYIKGFEYSKWSQFNIFVIIDKKET